jgi:hypothetical protein
MSLTTLPLSLKKSIHPFLEGADLGNLACTSQSERNAVYSNRGDRLPGIRTTFKILCPVPGSNINYLEIVKQYVERREREIYEQGSVDGPTIGLRTVQRIQNVTTGLATISVAMSANIFQRTNNIGVIVVPSLTFSSVCFTHLNLGVIQKTPLLARHVIHLLCAVQARSLLETSGEDFGTEVHFTVVYLERALGVMFVAHNFFSLLEGIIPASTLNDLSGRAYGNMRLLQYQESRDPLCMRITTAIKAPFRFLMTIPQLYLEAIE